MNSERVDLIHKFLSLQMHILLAELAKSEHVCVHIVDLSKSAHIAEIELHSDAVLCLVKLVTPDELVQLTIEFRERVVVCTLLEKQIVDFLVETKGGQSIAGGRSSLDIVRLDEYERGHKCALFHGRMIVRMEFAAGKACASARFHVLVVFDFLVVFVFVFGVIVTTLA